MRKPRGELPERRETLRAPSLFLCLLESTVGLRQFFGQQAVAKRLAAVLGYEPIYNDRRKEEKKVANGKLGCSFRCELLDRDDPNQERTVYCRGHGSPE